MPVTTTQIVFAIDGQQTDAIKSRETKPLKRLKDNLLLANAEISPTAVSKFLLQKELSSILIPRLSSHSS